MRGSFAPTAGGGGALDDIVCGVSVRLAHLDAARGPGCDLEVRGWEIESMWEALPSLRADALAFLNRDFDTRFGVRFDGWDAICDHAGNPCIQYPTATSARGTNPDDGSPWSISPFLQGCGSTEFPPNAAARGDMTNATAVNRAASTSACATPRTAATHTSPTAPRNVATLEQQFPDCGGGWQIYWRQSIPGFGTRARNADGTPMKNWWPLLFY